MSSTTSTTPLTGFARGFARELAPVIQFPRGGAAPHPLRQWGGEISSVEVAPGPWRLTRRGRVAVVLVAVVAVLAVLSVVQVVGASTSTSANKVALVAAQQQSDVVVVRPGDTLWSIAAREMPGRDPREAVVAIRQANGIASGEIAPGQRLHLPKG